jgi:hypothetical protein
MQPSHCNALVAMPTAVPAPTCGTAALGCVPPDGRANRTPHASGGPNHPRASAMPTAVPAPTCATAALGCVPHSARESVRPCGQCLRRTANSAHSAQRLGVAPVRPEPSPRTRLCHVAPRAARWVLGRSVQLSLGEEEKHESDQSCIDIRTSARQPKSVLRAQLAHTLP